MNKRKILVIGDGSDELIQALNKLADDKSIDFSFESMDMDDAHIVRMSELGKQAASAGEAFRNALLGLKCDFVVTDEVNEIFKDLIDETAKANESIKLVNRSIRDFPPFQTKFGKGDRRKNKKQFMNQINRKR